MPSIRIMFDKYSVESHEKTYFKNLLIAHHINFDIAITASITLLVKPKGLCNLFKKKTPFKLSLLELAAYQSCWSILKDLLTCAKLVKAQHDQVSLNKAVNITLRKRISATEGNEFCNKVEEAAKLLIRYGAEQPTLKNEAIILTYRRLKQETQSEKTNKTLHQLYFG